MTFRDTFRFALRAVAKQPLFSAVVVLSLGLAIGANSAIFSVIDAALLRPLSVHEPDRLINVYTTDSTGRGFGSTSYPDYAFLRDNAPGIDGVVGYSGLMTTLTDGHPEVVFGEMVSGNYFSVTGARLVLGRGFVADEDRVPGAAPVVVISDRLWRRRFAADSAVIGRSITMNGHPFTIVGVAAPEFTGLLFRGITTELWAPAMMMAQLRTDQLSNRAERWMFVKARLAPGATLEQASRGLTVLGARLAGNFPATNYGRTFAARPTTDVMVNPDGDRVVFPATVLLLVVTGLIVVIASTNIANLMFARAAARQREIAIRLAVGAARRDLIAQLLCESGILAVAGGAVGLGIAFGFAKVCATVRLPIPVPIALQIGLDARVILFTAGLTALAATTFGLLPALQATRPSLVAALTGAPAADTRRSAIARLRRAFLVPQMTLSLVLLVVAGLFARSVMNAASVDPGFDIEHTSMIALSLNLDGYDSVRARGFYDDLSRRLERHGGVRSITVTDRIPLDLYGNQSATILAPATSAEHVVQVARVDARYFETMGIRLARGRPFDDRDLREARAVAIVSEAMERRFWPRGAIGQTIRDREGLAAEIIGVARDTKVQTLGESPQPLLYRPMTPNYARLLRVVARSSTDPARTVALLRDEVAALDSRVAIFESQTMTAHLDVMLFPYRIGAAVSALLGLFGLALASIGLFGVVAFTVARRTREFGIRLALGATPRGVRRMVLREQAAVILLSLGLGLVLALATARLMASAIFGIAWNDPTTILSVVATLGGIALIASYVPAVRATAISPAAALRHD